MTATVEHIHIAPAHGAPVEARQEVTLADGGIEGDRNFGRARQVTLVCTGELAKAAAELGQKVIPPGATRRNITVSLDSLPRTPETRIRLGEVEVAVRRNCPPCEVMEESVGPGAQQALQARAGVSASVVQGGRLRVGDPVEILSNSQG